VRGPAPGPLGGLAEGHGRTLLEVPGAADVLSRLERMGQMQELMCGQFHDVMMMMSQAFGNSQREQATGLREELEEIRRLTREIQALRAATPAVAAHALTAETHASRAAAAPGSEPAARPDPAPLAPEGPGAAGPGPRLVDFVPPPESERHRSDPVAAHAIASASLAAYERDRQHRWKKVLKAMMSS